MKNKVEKFKVNIFDDCVSTPTSNIGYNGQRQCQTQSYNTTLTVYYRKGWNIIHCVSSNSMTVSEGDFGSYTRDLNRVGYLYIGKDKKDFDKAMKTLKGGELPNGMLSGVFMTNYDEETYHRNNDFPLSLSISSDEKSIIQSFDEEYIACGAQYHDDFVFVNNLHAYVDEDLNGEFFLSVEDLISINTSKKKRVDILWVELGILDNYDDEILNDSNFRQVIIDSINSLKLTEDNYSLDDLVNVLKNKTESFRKIEKEKKIRAEESNKKWSERNGGAVYLSEEQKNGSINLKTMEITSKTEPTKTDNIVVELNDIHYKCFGKICDYNYPQYMDYIINKLVSPSDSFDFDYGIRSIEVVKSLITKETLSKIDTSKVDLLGIYSILSADLELPVEKLNKLLALPIRSSLDIVKALVM